MRLTLLFLVVLLTIVPACSAQSNDDAPPSDEAYADVTAVEVRGDSADYIFSVTIRSPDTGCERYANWWEVVAPDGTHLIHRRIVAHPHTNEQPFTRSGGPVAIAPDSTVVVRAHMNQAGYGGQALRGTVDDGFSEAELPEGFGDEIEEVSPNCGF